MILYLLLIQLLWKDVLSFGKNNFVHIIDSPDGTGELVVLDLPSSSFIIKKGESKKVIKDADPVEEPISNCAIVGDTGAIIPENDLERCLLAGGSNFCAQNGVCYTEIMQARTQQEAVETCAAIPNATLAEQAPFIAVTCLPGIENITSNFFFLGPLVLDQVNGMCPFFRIDSTTTIVNQVWTANCITNPMDNFVCQIAI